MVSAIKRYLNHPIEKPEGWKDYPPSSPIGRLSGKWHIRYDYAPEPAWRFIGIKHKIFRLGNVYGPHSHEGVVTNFIDRIFVDESPTIYGDGAQTRDYIYIDDVVSALIAAVGATGDDDTYNVDDIALDAAKYRTVFQPEPFTTLQDGIAKMKQERSTGQHV